MSLLPQELGRELVASETLLWSGQPRQGVMLRQADFLLIPFSLLWGGFAFLWEASVIASGAPAPAAVFGLPFVAAAIYLIIGRFFIDAWQRAKTYYAVTTERVIIVSGIFSKIIKTLDLRTLGEMSLSERRDGTGSIVFGSASPLDWLTGGMSSWPTPGARQSSRFDQVAGVRTIYDTIRTARRSLAK
ncbi:MAG: PH domain-containing protein [Alphaproteobacteria bacterium]|nr:PH domain-containing protein [Alphaproteobacteria bacterium]